VRPGIALYGGRAHEDEPNPMQTVVRLKAKILQVREVVPGATIGYGAIYRVQRPSRIATIACGYADGFLRALSVATGEAGPVGYVGDYPVPIVGRVSMDFITVDVTDVPEDLTRRGGWVEVMGRRVTVDDLTDRAGTIGYELLARLGPRVYRVYEGPDAMAKSARAGFVCQSCGAVAPRWVGKCAGCGEWNTLVEETDTPQPGAGLSRASRGRAVALADLAQAQAEVAYRIPTGLAELDRVTGGGIVPGSVLLIGGEPGIGKSRSFCR
jgi:hypothetical protein